MHPKIQVIGKTDIGLVRSGNEDYLHIDEKNRVFAVCDGMGGHQAGEVASMTASQTILRVFSKNQHELMHDQSIALGKTLPESSDLLAKAVRLANRAVYDHGLKNSGLSGMGTTVVSVAFEADIMTIAHVGDSRAYLMKERELLPLTKDHSWLVEMQESQNMSEDEASSIVNKNVITRALGVKETVEVDVKIIKVKAGDTFILCSDGLCGFADDDEIFDVANKVRDDLDKLTTNLIQMANDRGGTDNVTVIALKIEEVTESVLPELEAITISDESESILEAEDKWLERFSVDEKKNELGDQSENENEGPNKLLIGGLFAVFIVVAVLIIIFYS